MIYLAIYIFLTALSHLILGIIWAADDPVQRCIKWTFIFLAAWGMFFGMLVVKGILNAP
jgi:hypothetical protein